MENSNIRDRVQRICKEILHWEKLVSGTWARHSFATNLKLAGVEEEYIAESIGHSHGNDVTAGYMDKYPALWKMKKRGALPYRKVGNRILFRYSDVENLVKGEGGVA